MKGHINTSEEQAPTPSVATPAAQQEEENILHDEMNSMTGLGDSEKYPEANTSLNLHLQNDIDFKNNDRKYIPNMNSASSTMTTSAAVQVPTTNLKEICITFEQGVTVRTHRYHLKKYPKTFVGSDAVDFLLSTNLATSRREAVQLGQALQKIYNLFHHVHHDHEFQDDYLFYRFVPKSERFDTDRTTSATMSSTMSTISEGQEDDSEIFQSNTKNNNLLSLENIAIQFEKGVPIQNRKRRMRTYTNAFVGSEAVDFLMTLGVVETRNDAVHLAQRMANELDLFQSANYLLSLHNNDSNNDDKVRGPQVYNFRDENLLFTFVDPSKRKPRKHSVPSTSMPLPTIDTNKNDNHVSSRMTSNENNSTKMTPTITDTTPEEKKKLIDIAIAFEKGIHVKDRKYRQKLYKECFVGSMAVDFFVNSSMANSRKEAVQLGRQLVQQLNLFQHVVGDHQFKDDYLFYEFMDESQRKYTNSSMYISYANSHVHQMSQTDLERIATNFRQGVRVKTHLYNFIPYKKTFIGSEAVDYLVHSNQADSRIEAVKLGRQLMKKCNLFQHVTQDHLFKDEYLFYRFVESQNDTATMNDGTTKSTNQKFSSFRKTLSKHSGLRQSTSSSATLDKSMTLEELINAFKNRHKDSKKLKEIISRNDIFNLDNLNHVATIFRNGIHVSNRTLKLKTYNNVFVGTEAVNFLVEMELSKTRDDAVKLGCRLADEYHLFEHVKNQHEFKDSHKFYKFVSNDTYLMDGRDLDEEQLMKIALKFEASVQLKSNRKGLCIYSDTFVGTDAITYLVDSKLANSRLEAVMIGRTIAQKFNLFEHVTNDHRLKDDSLFYRFISRSERCLLYEDKKNSFESNKNSDDWNKRARASEMKIASKKKYVSLGTKSQRGCPVIDSLEKDAMIHEKLSNKRRGDSVLSVRDDTSKSKSTRSTKRDIDEFQRIYATKNAYVWAASFRRLDPRYQISSFFDDVAQEGANEIEDKGVNTGLHPLLRYFSRASVFTVWRPTSLESIRKMMLGEGVGKGLDIKGKSAKRGKLSAYVPFLQISKNSHKRLIKTLPKDKTIRIFYGGYSKRGRNQMAELLEEVAEEMTETVKLARQVLESKNSDKEAKADALESLSLEMTDPAITYLDQYAPQSYGLEVPIRLFWEFYVAEADISREPGGELDVGRPSLPAFQDMNNSALTYPPKFPGAPRAVVWQLAGMDSSYCPLHLVMGYEEHGRVKPVVSDFDSFLMGTRGVEYSKPLPPEQRSMADWSVSNIGKVLDSPSQENWTNRWLEVLKKEGSNKDLRSELPQYGFGDPKSYSIMEYAVDRLKGSGAIRHGAECFNFLFPQELDDEFLIISDPSIVTDRVSWRYVDESGLQKFLIEMLHRGYTFPLNPKWVLCDPGWKDIYDKLLMSDHPNVQESLNTWFPKNSGIREKIEEIYQRHPDGFTRHRRDVCSRRGTGTAEMDLAMESLKDSTVLNYSARRCSSVLLEA